MSDTSLQIVCLNQLLDLLNSGKLEDNEKERDWKRSLRNYMRKDLVVMSVLKFIYREVIKWENMNIAKLPIFQ